MLASQSAHEADGDRTTWTYDPTYKLLSEHRTGGVAYLRTSRLCVAVANIGN